MEKHAWLLAHSGLAHPDIMEYLEDAEAAKDTGPRQLADMTGPLAGETEADKRGGSVSQASTRTPRRYVFRRDHLTTPDRVRFAAPLLPQPMSLPPSATPTLSFTNARRFGKGSVAGEGELSPRLGLPECIHFYVHVKSARVGFPFPPGVSTKQFLMKATMGSAHETPAATLSLDPKHIIGLSAHQMLAFCQLVLVVPSTSSINARLHPTKLSFHPAHAAQLHHRPDAQLHRRGGSSAATMGAEGPLSSGGRIIVPVWPHLISRNAERPRGTRSWNSRPITKPLRSDGHWVGTFGSSDGRMGPAYRQQIHTPQVHTGQAQHGHSGHGHSGHAHHEHRTMAAAPPWPSPPPPFAPTHLRGHSAVAGQDGQEGCEGRPVPSAQNGVPSAVNGPPSAMNGAPCGVNDLPSAVNGRLPSGSRWISDGSDDDLAIEPDCGEPTGGD